MSAIKRISALLVLIALTFVCAMSATATGTDIIFDTRGANDGVKDTDGAITIKGTLLIDGGIPVTVMIASQVFDTDNVTDITAEKISAASTIAEFLAVVEYTQTFILPEDGRIELSFNAKESMSTGKANIYVSFNGGKEIVKIGDFEHVGKDDVNGIISKFNLNPYESYPGFIKADTESTNVLEKIGADIKGYKEVNDTEAFSQILCSKKPETGFDSQLLIDSFNEAVAWAKLWETEDTLGILESYNNVYWVVDTAENSDFASVSAQEKEKILSEIKNGKFTEKSTLENAFKENLALAAFRSVTDRNALLELLGKNEYSEYFAEANESVSTSELNEYKLIGAYNYVLDRNSRIETVDKLNSLFADAIAAQKTTSGGSGGGGGGFGGGSSKSDKTSDIVLQLPGEIEELDPQEGFIKETEHPFEDVKAEHWANSYITKMYKDGVISGKTATSFAPEEKIVRQDFVKLVVSMLGIETSDSESVFDDVEKGSFYEPYIMAAVNAGIIKGTDENTFGMSVNIKREDASVIIARILASKGFTAENEAQFADNVQISAYALESVTLTASTGLFKGDENQNFNPAASLSRAEAAAVLVRLSEIINK